MNNFARVSYLFSFVCFVFVFSLLFERSTANKLTFINYQPQEITQSTVSAVRIRIPSLQVDSSVFPASIEKSKWQVASNGVSHLSSSSIPGARGNSILYGHNWPNILGKLPQIKPGEKIEITLSSGEVKSFVVNYTTMVEPTQTQILADTDTPQLTLYTCAGFLDTKRFVATATLL